LGAITSLVRARPPELALERSARTSPARLEGAAAALTYAWDGRVPIANARSLRHWYKTSEWVRGAVDIRTSQVSAAEWDIVPFDQRRPYSKRLQRQIREQLRDPNPASDSWRSFIEPITRDLLVLDAGTIEKVRNLQGDLLELWPVDASKVRVSATWDGDPKESRYFWCPDGNRVKESFRNADFIYMMAYKRTDSPIGMPPLDTLKLTIEAELSAHEYNRRQVAGAAPDGLMNLGENFSRDQVRDFRSFFESEVAGRGAIGFIGGTKSPSWIPFRDNNRNMQFLEWQIYLVRKIAVVFGLTPQDLGITFDVNRSTAETQIQISEDRGLRPLMSLLQEYVTTEVVWDDSFGGMANNLAFRFTELNLKESTAKAAILEKALAGVPWRYINEARIAEGREPIKELEGKLVMETPQGALDISDVPTVREYLEMTIAAKQAAKPPDGGKAVEIQVDAPDLSPMSQMVERLVVAQEQANAGLIEVANRPQPPIQVSVDASQNREVPGPARERTLSREIEFTFDAQGRVIGKHVVETREKDLASREAEDLEAQTRTGEAQAAEHEAQAAVNRATDPGTRRVIRETKFKTDDTGRIVGAEETEFDADQ
jgi:phage portal protein BeeE